MLHSEEEFGHCHKVRAATVAKSITHNLVLAAIFILISITLLSECSNRTLLEHPRPEQDTLELPHTDTLSLIFHKMQSSYFT